MASERMKDTRPSTRRRAPQQALIGPTELRPDPSRLSDRVAIDLGSRIVRGELAAGSRLPTEAELGDLFGVSRSVIRDAVRTLSALGLVEVKQGVGMLVASPNEAPFTGALIIRLMRSDLTVGDVFEGRAAIEIEIAGIVAGRGTEEDWAVIERALADFLEAVEGRDWERAERFHLAFHLSVLRAAHLPALEILLRPMHEIIMLSSLPPSLEGKDLADVWTIEDARRHVPIFEALRDRDEERAREAMSDHFPLLDDSLHAERKAIRFRDSQFVQALFSRLLSTGPSGNDRAPSGMLANALEGSETRATDAQLGPGGGA
jgi:DNA-binding FadR family transcriptional regulator